MITITSQELHNQTHHVQRLAQTEPVIIDNGNQFQVLMDYNDFLKLAQPTNHKPFISLGEVFTNLPPDVAQALELVDEDEEDTLTKNTTALLG